VRSHVAASDPGVGSGAVMQRGDGTRARRRAGRFSPKWRRRQIGVRPYEKAPFTVRTYTGVGSHHTWRPAFRLPGPMRAVSPVCHRSFLIDLSFSFNCPSAVVAWHPREAAVAWLGCLPGAGDGSRLIDRVDGELAYLVPGLCPVACEQEAEPGGGLEKGAEI
jgi:hypothetical protein